MAPRKVVSDEALLKAFEETGSIRGTARRVSLSYTSAHERLRRLNAMPPVKQDVYAGPSFCTIPEGDTLILPDIQAPAQHPDTLAFLCTIRDRYKPKNIVCIGDELDLNFLSDFAKLPESDQPMSEFASALAFVRALFAEFPEAVSCTSNHVHGRFDKARLRGRIPPHFLRPVEDLVDAPDGWSWFPEIRMGDIIIRHGHKDVMNLKRVILEEMPARHGRHFSILLGHYHQRLGQHTPDIQVGDRFYWGGFVGCLINPRHPFFGYSRGYEKLGTVMIRDGRLRPFSMPVDGDGRWTGELL